MLIAAEGKIFRSTDEGSSWSQFDPRRAPGDLPSELGRIVVSALPEAVVYIERAFYGSLRRVDNKSIEGVF